MPFRRLLLKIMFISLAAAALLGAAGVMMASSEAMWRIVGTCVATAAAAMLLLASGLLAKREKNSAIAASALIIVEYLFTLSFIWEIWGYDVDEKAAGTMFLIAAVGVPVIAFIHFRENRATRVTARVGLVLSGIVFVLLMLAVWVFSSGRTEDVLFEIAGAISALGTLGLLCLVGVGVHEDHHHWRWVGVGAAAVALAMASYAIILNIHSGSVVFVAIVVLAAVVAHANVLMRVPLTSGQAWLRWITIAAAIATGACIVVISRDAWKNSMRDLAERLASACAIIAGCGSLALLVLARINRRIDVPPPQLASIQQVAVTCPMCQKKQTVPTGDARCMQCGLVIQIRIAEPRCPNCNYSLLMLKSDRCPECGTAIAVSSQQSAVSQINAAGGALAES